MASKRSDIDDNNIDKNNNCNEATKILIKHSTCMQY